MIDEFRTALQDLVTPDLKALQEKLSGLEKTVDTRLSAFSSSISTSIDAQNIALTANKEALTAKIDQLLSLVDSNHKTILQSLNLEKRLEALETRQAAPVAVQGIFTQTPLVAAEPAQSALAAPISKPQAASQAAVEAQPEPAESEWG